MKVTTVGTLAALGMTLTSLSVWSLVPPAGAGPAADPRGTDPVVTVVEPAAQPSFTAGQVLMLEGRAGHPELQAGGTRSTWTLLTVTAPEGAAPSTAPLNLSIVIDRSGSMKGRRLANALSAARGMVGRLRDGDVVSVIAYDTSAELLLPATALDASSRSRALDAIDRIVARGDTCISCGIERGLEEITRRSGMVDRMLLLSDGEATAGVRDLEGFRRLGERARARGVAVSSIGVDVDYNERVMSVLARESNGRHHFVESDTTLSTVFDRELASLQSSVATDGELRIELPPGVELVSLVGRSFRREGDTLIVPLGAFSAGEQKTVLLSLNASVGEGVVPLGRYQLGYRDLRGSAPGHCSGALSALGVEGPGSVLDPLVAARVNRGETASVLEQANQLFATGRVDEARQAIGKKLDELRSRERDALAAARPEEKRKLADDFDRQSSALSGASRGFAAEPPPTATAPGAAPKPAAPSRQGRAQVRSNAEAADAFSF